MASSTISGFTSSFTPIASRRSALPHLLETERFPCLATVTPQPATIKAVVVEILKVCAASPPVPHVSTTIPEDTWMRKAFLRMALAAPANSSNVSPFVARAAIKAPICASVILPDKISVIISDISVSLRLFLWMILFKFSRNITLILLLILVEWLNCYVLCKKIFRIRLPRASFKLCRIPYL